ncbi:MAG: exodeoxyribonuclease VII small subunit [Chloroflexia bacterium]
MEPLQPEEALSFEEAYSRLEEVVRRLEEEVLPLEEALALYERGIALARHCQALLDRTELRITQLVEEGNEIREKPFEPECGP